MTILAVTVRNANIGGVASAIATGGPGAPFWMWISGFIGMATKYAECFWGMKLLKVADHGSMAGGPLYYYRPGIRNQSVDRFLEMLLANCYGLTALMGTGKMMPSNSMALAWNSQFSVSTSVHL